MSNFAQLVSGYKAEAHRKTYSEPAYVTLHLLGHEGTGYMTPSEARLLADALILAAKVAEES